MALSETVVNKILVTVAITAVIVVMIGLHPIYKEDSSSSAVTGSTTPYGPTTGSNSNSGSSTILSTIADSTTIPPSTTTTATTTATTTTRTTVTTTAAPTKTTATTAVTTPTASTTTSTAGAATTTIVPVACNAAYQAIANHSICGTDNADLLNFGVTATQKQQIVDIHNTYRRNPYPKSANTYGSAMRKLVWDDNIAAIAQQYARSCPADHEPSADRRKVIGYNIVVGQNLAWGPADWTGAFLAWFNEYKLFTYGTGGDQHAVGHYTQVVFDETTRIGCGFAQCDTSYDTYFVCNYATIQSAYKFPTPFINGTACAACVNHCDNGLCDCNGLICFTGTINLNTCTCV